jgi:hypothetical protein
MYIYIYNSPRRSYLNDFATNRTLATPRLAKNEHLAFFFRHGLRRHEGTASRSGTPQADGGSPPQPQKHFVFRHGARVTLEESRRESHSRRVTLEESLSKSHCCRCRGVGRSYPVHWLLGCSSTSALNVLDTLDTLDTEECSAKSSTKSSAKSSAKSSTKVSSRSEAFRVLRRVALAME